MSGFAFLVLAGGILLAQEKKGTARKASLPTYWSRLGLSDAQKSKVHEIQADYRGRIEALQAQIKQLQQDERTALGQVLTDKQRQRLREILASRTPGLDEDKKSAGDKKK